MNDTDSEDVYYHTLISIHKKERHSPVLVTTIVPLTDPRPTQLTVSVVSDRYVGLEFFETITVPTNKSNQQSLAVATTLLDLYPLPKSALRNEGYESLFRFTHFNPIQTQVFHQLYHGDGNVLIGAPTGSGKTVIAELAIFRVFNQYPKGKVIYIAPMKALSRERISDWTERMGRQLGRKVVELTGDFTPDAAALHRADIVVTTPEKWDGISRNWKHREYVKNTALVIIDEIHLLGQERGAILEIIVSRMRLIATETGAKVRFVGLSTALANASEIASWLNVEKFTGLFNFKPSVRSVPMTVHVQGFPDKHYCPRMATMNKPCLQSIKTYSLEKPVIVFVSSRRQTRLTAFDLIAYASQDQAYYAALFQGPGRSPWLRLDAEIDEPIEQLLERVENDALKHTLAYGVGIHHAGLKNSDRELVERLFASGKIQILVATTTVGVGVNLPAHLVVVKGTEYFDPKTKKYVDMPTTDVLQMMGRAGRPQFDTSAVSVVMVHEPKKNFYRKFLYSPFPLESSLHLQLAEHLNAEIASGSIGSLEDAIEFLSWTYLFRRVSANPDFYIESKEGDPVESTPNRVVKYLSSLVETEVRRLELSACVTVTRPMASQGGDTLFQPTRVGQICSLYYLKHATVSHFLTQLVLVPTPESGRTIFDLAKTLADCAEYAEFPMRHQDDVYCEDLSKRLPITVSSPMDSPHTKGLLVVLAHMFGVPMPIEDFYTDLKSFLDQSVRIIQGMLEIVLTDPGRKGSFKTVVNILILNQCLSLGLHPWKNLTEFMIGKKIKGLDCSFPALIEKVNTSRVSAIDTGAYTLLKKMPLVKMTGVMRGRTLSVEVTSLNKHDPYCQTPLSMLDAQNSGGKKRRVAWWVVVGDEGSGRVIAAKRISVTGAKKIVDFKLNPHVANGEIKVILMSDCYYGIDQEIVIG